MNQPAPITTRGHPYGKLSSWLVVAAALAAFVAGAVALILGWWWLLFVMAGVFGACVPAGAAVGMMHDTVAWTTPLHPHTRIGLDAANPTDDASTHNTGEADQPDE